MADCRANLNFVVYAEISRQFGILTFWRYSAAQSFRPAPKVDSAIVRMIPRSAAEIIVRNEELFAAIVGAAIGQRRNTLRNYLDGADFELGIDAQLRAETCHPALHPRKSTAFARRTTIPNIPKTCPPCRANTDNGFSRLLTP